MAHGREREGLQMLASTVPFYRRLRETEGYRPELVEILLVTGQLEAAREQALVDLRTVKSIGDSMGSLTYLGAIASKQGRDDEAKRYFDAVARYLDEEARYGRIGSDTERRPGAVAWSRAYLAAWRGDREGAVRFLEEARAYGAALTQYHMVHREPAFAWMRDYPPFQQFLKPRD